MGKLLARLNFSHISPRPLHPGQNAAAQEVHKKLRRAGRRRRSRPRPRQTDRALVADAMRGDAARADRPHCRRSPPIRSTPP
ncbi:MAG: hypothetical protein B7Z80_25210 [Rhodospirillales bacterium 20-64-7]|nr:MAG: hypothetical protein B7Z80_25210 [Rhodospirillales bacterium 20-64-7]